MSDPKPAPVPVAAPVVDDDPEGMHAFAEEMFELCDEEIAEKAYFDQKPHYD